MTRASTAKLADWPGFTIAAWQHRPESSGYVRAKSADPFQKPAIQPNYLAHETDQRAVVRPCGWPAV